VQVVNGQAVPADHPADATAEGQPAQADRRGVAGGRRQAKGIGMRGVGTPGQAWLRPRHTAFGVDADALTAAEVQDKPAFDRSVAGQAVAAAADRQWQVLLTDEADRADHVGGIGGAHDQRRMRVDGQIVDAPRRVVVVVRRPDQFPQQVCFEIADGGGGGMLLQHHGGYSWRFRWWFD
jgi:hypothetical protein